jgi:hypothetical protein
MRCEGCGANLPPNATTCPYCQVTTALGHAQARERQHQESQRAAHAQYQQQHAQQQHAWALERRAKTLPLWGLFALLVPCLGVPALIAGLVALGVRGQAKRAGLPVPGQVPITLGMAGVGLALSIGLIVWFKIDAAEHEEHVAALEKKVRPLADKPMLNQHDACAIAEWVLERDGYAGVSGLNLEGFRCDGRLLATAPDKLMLEAVTFKSVGKPESADVCFVRRARWTVERTVAVGAGCDAPAPGGSAAASGAATTTTTAAPGSSPAGKRLGR